MEIRKVTENKKQYIDLLLLADEQEDMIDKYLNRGEMFVLDDCGIKAECVITKEAEGVYELKNIAVRADFQRNGYSNRLIEFLFSYYPDCKTMLVGTGDSPNILRFYHKCGFTESHRIKKIFTDNYNHPIFENGKQLVDMIYLKWERKAQERGRDAINQATITQKS
ncbi:GNAT family N-acetyltransferase [Candidatus Contubernalis alkaliaceticus]|uniref:GNAT family N-acetyltransferase n=1 Tax=Candidatus Contubernalis alkaliaceticus TaxID=338645 RepID=UPI001F4BE4F2|nr:GNAT family N-acetyltransferase [Candidatus Contubernalis alkalaceticus]UNC92344.1 GNAT family N-acetyltransferase [Candidatus Contubernalis alkalaceticus]